MKVWLVLLVLACSSKHGTGPGTGTSTNGSGLGTETGSASTPPLANAKTCDDVQPRVEQMYRAEAQVREPKRVEEAVADNTAMVMADCARAPATAVPCLAAAATIAELEQRCLAPLDDEGSEGDAFAR